MFDKNLFDRNAFDRSVSSDGITVAFLSTGRFDLNLNVRSPIQLQPFSGNGQLSPGLTMRQSIEINFAGGGSVKDTTVVLRRSTTSKLTGQGSLVPNIVVKTPIAANLNGGGGLNMSSRMFLYQQMRGTIAGSGAVSNKLIVATALAGAKFAGNGKLSGSVVLNLPLTINMNGSGEFVLRRLGALNENVIELIGINLMPGESVTIDTDLLQVLIGAVEDVSSVTTDSVFFELNPGTNDIVVSTDVDGPIDVTAIWQNRWL